MKLYHGTTTHRLKEFEKRNWDTNGALYLAEDKDAAESYAFMRLEEDTDEFFEDESIAPAILVFDSDVLEREGELGPDWDDAWSVFKSGEYPEPPVTWSWEMSLERLGTCSYSGPLRNALIEKIVRLNETKTPPLQQLVESLVGEILLEAQPEAPEEAPFGQYLFADPADDIRLDDVEEVNTEKESEFLSALRSW